MMRDGEVELHVLGCRLTYYTQLLGTDCDKARFNVALRPQKTVRLIRTESPGRPPRLSHNPCALIAASVWVQLKSWWLFPPKPVIFKIKNNNNNNNKMTAHKASVLPTHPPPRPDSSRNVMQIVLKF